jgi:protein-S-isoprenylcysteine O-methyltransferase Ste14
MTSELDPKTERRLQRVIDFAERLFVAILFAIFMTRIFHTIALRPYNMLAVISEGLGVYFIVVRRPAAAITMRPLDWFVALMGTAFPMFVFAGGEPLVPPIIGSAIMSAGVMLAIWAKASLRHSFGMAAANRGPVNEGPYRGIRHPMYAGYMLVYVGFFLNNPLAWNAAVYILGIGFQIARILVEERILTQDPKYANYRSHVLYRLVPGIF